MAKFEMRGMDKYLKKLTNIAWATADVCNAAVYAGAKVVADEIKTEIKGLKTTTDGNAMNAWHKGEATYISETQKKGLEKSFGIAPIRDDFGDFNTKLGFDGYNEVKTKRFPNGQPNALIARSCNNGTSAMYKQPFLRRAVDRARKPAISAMDDAANKKIEKIMGGK